MNSGDRVPVRIAVICAMALLGGGLGFGLAQSNQGGALPLEPARKSGASVTPAFEGWYQNPDGSYSLLIGYYNRNTEETLDIPVGPLNRIEPGEAGSGPADALPDGPPVGRLRHQGPQGLRQEDLALDDRGKRRATVGAVQSQPGVRGDAVQGSRDEQFAAEADLRGERPEGDRTADGHRGGIDRQGRRADSDRRLDRGRQRYRAKQVARRSAPCRFTSIAVPAA